MTTELHPDANHVPIAAISGYNDATTQIEFERMFAKSELFPTVRAYFNSPDLEMLVMVANAKAAEVEDPDEYVELEHEFVTALLAELAVRKRAQIEVLVGRLWHHFETHENPFQECADHIVDATVKGFANYDPEYEDFVVVYEIPDTLQARLDLFQYPMPFVVPPREVKTNNQTGYYSLIGCIVLGASRGEKTGDLCLDHINRMNSVPLRINETIATEVPNQWKDLDRMQPGETLPDFRKRRAAHANYMAKSLDAIEALALLGGTFWLSHKYDHRGRSYASGYHVNPQGNDWNKACIEFAEGEVVRCVE